MKRFVFVDKTLTIPDQNGSVIALRASSISVPDLKIPGDRELYFFSFPLTLKTQGDHDFQLMFRLPKLLINKKLVLGGAYLTDGRVNASFINYGETINLMEKEVVLEAVLIEDVKYFQRTPEEKNEKAITTLNAVRKPRRK